jgi:uncharacterized protein (TIGR00251 family)
VDSQRVFFKSAPAACDAAMLRRKFKGQAQATAVTIWGMPSTRLEVYIQPRASKSEVAGMHDGVIKIRIAAPAVENAANEALVEFLADRLGIAKRSVRIVSGGASRRKRLEIEDVTEKEIAAKLK